MPVDPELLAAARAAASALQEAESAIAPLREAYRQRLRVLHAGGASLRDIAAALGLSHQRVHQLVQPDDLAMGRAGRPHAAAEPAVAGRVCALCGEAGEVRMAGDVPVCAPCRRAGKALLTGRGEGSDSRLRLLRRHQRPRCGACGRLPAAGEAFVAGGQETICPECLDAMA